MERQPHTTFSPGAGGGGGLQSPSSTSFVIYRDHKYYGLAKRVFHYSLVLIRFYITEPLSRRLTQFKNYLLELCGLILFLLLLPVLCVSAFCVYVSRISRIILIRRFYPKLEVCDDFSLRSSFTSSSPQSPIVSCVIWLNGRVTAKDLMKRYHTHFNNANTRCTTRNITARHISSKFGIIVAQESSTVAAAASPFDIAWHIIETSTNPISSDLDEHSSSPPHGYGHKTKLPKLIANILSKNLHDEDKRRPQWQITLIPVAVQMPAGPSSQHQHVNVKVYKTCCILRFHYVILQDHIVRQFLDCIFDPVVQQFSFRNNNRNSTLGVVGFKRFRIIQNGMNKLITSGVRKNQWTTIISNFVRIVIKTLVKIDWTEVCMRLGQRLRVTMFLLRSFSSIPIQLLQNLVWKSSSGSEKAYGFSKVQTDDGLQQEIAWSTSIRKDLIDQIKEKTGYMSTTESVILCVLSMGLNQYYVETSLPNPGTLRIAIPTLNPNGGFKSVIVKTNTTNRLSYGNGNEKYVLWSNLLQSTYPEWKETGSEYLHTFMSQFLPRYLVRAIILRSGRRHPIQLSFINDHNSNSHSSRSMWGGHNVEEISYWGETEETESCPRVSIVLVNSTNNSNSANVELIRLIVHSPMKLLATSLTKYLDTYLNEIAEMVGVDKARIPYHRRLSFSPLPPSL